MCHISMWLAFRGISDRGDICNKRTYKRKIGNLDAVYTYYKRTLSIKDFEQFDHETSYEDMIMRLGEPNGWVGSGMVWPYYELADHKFAVCHCVRGGKLMQISIYDQRNFEYKLLPLKLTLMRRSMQQAGETGRNEWMNGVECE